MATKLLEKPDLFQAKKVLVVQPHYDDNDITLGGTLAKLAAKSTGIFYLTVTDDLVGVVDQSLSEADMLAGLKDDLERAGKIIRVKDSFWLAYPDGVNMIILICVAISSTTFESYGRGHGSVAESS